MKPNVKGTFPQRNFEKVSSVKGAFILKFSDSKLPLWSQVSLELVNMLEIDCMPESTWPTVEHKHECSVDPFEIPKKISQ